MMTVRSVTLLLVTTYALATAQVTAADSTTYSETIDGKEYRIEPGENAGTFRVSYGGDSYLWEPKDWYDDELRKQGPAFYRRWSQPKLPYPWEIGVADRIDLAKKNPGEILDRYHAATYYFSFGKAFGDVAYSDLISADGFTRRKVLQEWGQSYVPEGKNWENLATPEKGVVSRKYMYVYREPNEVRGLGGRTVNFVSHERRPDEWLYTPAVRKVRRLSSAASQDYLPGTLAHFDQLSHTQALPDMNYRLAGIELYKGLPEVYGFRGDREHPRWPDGGHHYATDGLGDLVFLIEVTPKEGVSWWFAKSYRRYGVNFSFILSEDAYDENGERIQTFVNRPMVPPKELRGKLPPYYVHWGMSFLEEPKSGFKNDLWQAEPITWDPDLPPWLFNPDTLLQEPTSIVFW